MKLDIWVVWIITVTEWDEGCTLTWEFGGETDVTDGLNIYPSKLLWLCQRFSSIFFSFFCRTESLVEPVYVRWISVSGSCFCPHFLFLLKQSLQSLTNRGMHKCFIRTSKAGCFFFPDPTVEQRIMGKISVSGCYLATLSRREWQTRMLALSGPRQLEQAISQAGPNEEAGIKGVEMGRQRLIPSLVRAQWEGAYMAKPGDWKALSSSSGTHIINWKMWSLLHLTSFSIITHTFPQLMNSSSSSPTNVC